MLQSQKRRPVNEREGVRAGKRSLSFVSQVEPEVRSLSERCPLLVLPGTSPVGGRGGHGTRRRDFDGQPACAGVTAAFAPVGEFIN